MRRLTIIVLAFGAAGSPLLAAKVPAARSVASQDDAALARLIGATRAICEEPDTYGYSASGEAKIGASATIPKLLGKLFSFGLSGSLETAGEVHHGIAQKDAGLVKVVALHCRQNVFADLNRRGSFTDLGTGRRVAKVTNARTYYLNHQNTTEANLSGNSVGNGSAFVGGDVNAPLTIVNGPVPGSQTNHDKIVALATYMKEANAMEQAFSDRNDVDSIKMGYSDWYMRVDSYLTAQFDISYSAAFESATSDALGMAGHNEVGNTYWNLLRNKSAVLGNMITELRR